MFFYSASPHVILTQDDGAVLSTRDVGFNQCSQNKKRSVWAPRFYFRHPVGLFWALAERQIIIVFFFFLLHRDASHEPTKSINWGAEMGDPWECEPPPKVCFGTNDPALHVQTGPITLLSKSRGGKKTAANKQT